MLQGEIMTSTKKVRVVTHGCSTPVRVAVRGPSDPVEVVTSGPSDPVRIVDHGTSDPVRGILSNPQLIYAEIDNLSIQTVHLTFDQPIKKSGGDYLDGWTVGINHLWYSPINGTLIDSTHIDLEMVWIFTGADIVEVNYEQTTGYITDMAGHPLITLHNYSVANLAP